MQRTRRPQIICAVFAFVVWTAPLLRANASGATGHSVFFFDYRNGTGFGTGLTIDAAGNFWGISPIGGTYGYGNVFELTRNVAGQWTETVLYSFTNGNDGGIPDDDDGPLIDSAGNLYGTTSQGGAYGGGTVFKLTQGSGGWEETVLWSFTNTCGNGGCEPAASLVSDSAGNLYGTTAAGGGGTAFGTVFELSPDGSGNWKLTTLYTFSGGRDGGGPFSTLVLDQSGNIYGTTSWGGFWNNCVGDAYGCGVVFELTEGVDGNWNEQVLYAFRGGKDGARPGGKLAFDASGNIYGVTSLCGDFVCGPYAYVGYGTVFRLAPPTSSGGQWTFTRLHAFTDGSDGAYPGDGVFVDKTGVVYGTASEGGQGQCGYAPAPGCGTVYRIAPTLGGKWDFDVVYSFSGGADGGEPFKASFVGSTAYIPTGVGGLLDNNLCPFGCGTIFLLSPANQSVDTPH